MMQFFVVGVSHKEVPLASLGLLSLDSELQAQYLKEIYDTKIASEAAVVSTCNRLEWYFCACAPDAMMAWINAKFGDSWKNISDKAYIYKSTQAVAHLFSVAAGIQSLMLGETEILHQVKASLFVAESAGTAGTFIKKSFQAAFRSAKRIRSQTAISRYAVSIPGAVCSLTAQFASKLDRPAKVLIIGAGNIIQGCISHFKNNPSLINSQFVIVNRTLENAITTAKLINAVALPLTGLSAELIRNSDIIISGVSAPKAIIGTDTLMNACALSGGPALLIDLGMPVNIEDHSFLISLPNGASLYRIEQLTASVAENQKQREVAAEQAKTDILLHAETFINAWRKRQHIPLIQSLQAHAQKLSETEFHRALNALQQGENPETVLRRFSRALTNKLLHSPLKVLAQTAGDETLAAHIARMYQLSAHTESDKKNIEPSLNTIQDAHERFTKN